jgi:hypothetical protein
LKDKAASDSITLQRNLIEKEAQLKASEDMCEQLYKAMGAIRTDKDKEVKSWSFPLTVVVGTIEAKSARSVAGVYHCCWR